MSDRNEMIQRKLEEESRDDRSGQLGWEHLPEFPELDAEEFASGIAVRKDRERLAAHPDLYIAQLLLFQGACLGDAEMTAQALQQGADPNLKWRGNTAMHMAAMASSPLRTGSDGALRELIKAGGDVHVRNKRGETALHIAAWGGNPSAIHALLGAGADPLVKDRWGRLPIELAARKGMSEVCQILGEAMLRVVGISEMDVEIALRFMPKPPKWWKGRPKVITAGRLSAILLAGLLVSGCAGKGTSVYHQGQTWNGDPVRVLNFPEDPVRVATIEEVVPEVFDNPFQGRESQVRPKLVWNRGGIVTVPLEGTEPRDESLPEPEIAAEIPICPARDSVAGRDPEFAGRYPVLVENQTFRVRRAVDGDTWWGLSLNQNLSLSGLAALNGFGSRTPAQIMAGVLSVNDKMWFISGNEDGPLLDITFCEPKSAGLPIQDVFGLNPGGEGYGYSELLKNVALSVYPDSLAYRFSAVREYAYSRSPGNPSLATEYIRVPDANRMHLDLDLGGFGLKSLDLPELETDYIRVPDADGMELHLDLEDFGRKSGRPDGFLRLPESEGTFPVRWESATEPDSSLWRKVGLILDWMTGRMAESQDQWAEKGLRFASWLLESMGFPDSDGGFPV